jgi:hypothetical protein
MKLTVIERVFLDMSDGVKPVKEYSLLSEDGLEIFNGHFNDAKIFLEKLWRETMLCDGKLVFKDTDDFPDCFNAEAS